MLIRILCHIALLAWCSPTFADVFIVLPGSHQIMIGASTSIDVFIASNATATNPDNLASFAAAFQIIPLTPSSGGGVQFTNPQRDSQIHDPGYVFANDSLIDSLLDKASNVSSVNYTNDRLLAGDASLLGDGALLVTDDPLRLLLRLDLNATSLTSRIGSQFQLVLIDDSANPDPLTHFWDLDQNDLGIDPASFTPTLITVVVPEPCSLCGSAIGVLGAVAAYRNRKRRSLSLIPRKDSAGSPT